MLIYIYQIKIAYYLNTFECFWSQAPMPIALASSRFLHPSFRKIYFTAVLIENGADRITRVASFQAISSDKVRVHQDDCVRLRVRMYVSGAVSAEEE